MIFWTVAPEWPRPLSLAVACSMPLRRLKPLNRAVPRVPTMAPPAVTAPTLSVFVRAPESLPPIDLPAPSASRDAPEESPRACLIPGAIFEVSGTMD